MPRQFNYQSIQHTWLNQCPNPQRDGTVIICYRCRKKFDTYYKENKWFPVQNIPAEKGGRFNKENCIIVCADCFNEITEARSKPHVDSPKDDSDLFSD